MTKQIIAFDLDGTLAPSKAKIAPDMARVLQKLLRYHYVCVISGESFTQFRIQLIDELDATDSELKNLYLMPTCGTQCYRYKDTAWREEYAENLSDDEKALIVAAIHAGMDALNLIEPKTYGPVVEDRGSQITFSALGQDVVAELGEKGIALKERWDPSHAKKRALQAYLAKRLCHFEVRVGGSTSVDVTKPGIDKAYGIRRLMDLTGVPAKGIVFFGDRLEEGGNDYPVRATGVDAVAVTDWRDTLHKVQPYVKKV